MISLVYLLVVFADIERVVIVPPSGDYPCSESNNEEQALRVQARKSLFLALYGSYTLLEQPSFGKTLVFEDLYPSCLFNREIALFYNLRAVEDGQDQVSFNPVLTALLEDMDARLILWPVTGRELQVTDERNVVIPLQIHGYNRWGRWDSVNLSLVWQYRSADFAIASLEEVRRSTAHLIARLLS